MLLVAAIRYVEDQHVELSRESQDFLDWARGELAFADTLLQQQQLLDQLLSYRAAQRNSLAVA